MLDIPIAAMIPYSSKFGDKDGLSIQNTDKSLLLFQSTRGQIT